MRSFLLLAVSPLVAGFGSFPVPLNDGGVTKDTVPPVTDACASAVCMADICSDGMGRRPVGDDCCSCLAADDKGDKGGGVTTPTGLCSTAHQPGREGSLHTAFPHCPLTVMLATLRPGPCLTPDVMGRGCSRHVQLGLSS